MNTKKSKPIPSFKSDAEAEHFVDTADLSQYDLSGFKPVQFELAKKEAALYVRLPAALMNGIKQKAAAQGIPYSRYVRMVLEQDLRHKH